MMMRINTIYAVSFANINDNKYLIFKMSVILPHRISFLAIMASYHHL